MRGKFITLEGGDGAGKSTLLNKIESHLQSQQLRFIKTREPGGTALAEQIRDLILQTSHSMNAVTELFLYEAARAEHVDKVILPVLNQGTHVLCDRFTHSTLAYQGFGRGLGQDLVSEMNKTATFGLNPDLTIWLKISPDKARQRIKSRGQENRLDQEKDDFHEKVYDAFLMMAKSQPQKLLVLDALKNPEEIFQDLLNSLLWRNLNLSNGNRGTEVK